VFSDDTDEEASGTEAAGKRVHGGRRINFDAERRMKRIQRT